MNPLRTVGGRLALGLALVVAGALLLADLIVVPSLERHLIDSKLSQLRHDTPAIATRLANTTENQLHQQIVKAAQEADARVIYYTPTDFRRKILTVFDDSNPVTSADVENDPLVVKAFDAYPNPVSGTVTSGERRYAEVGYPLRNGAVVVVRSPLRDTLQSISQVRRRLVIAGLIALAGSGASSALHTGLPPATSASRSSTAAGTSSASSQRRSTTCGSAWRSSSTRGASSSPMPPTSCGRRSSRSAASSRSWTTRSSIRRRRRSSWPRCASRSRA
jgi:hypothetical protein